MQRSLVSFWIYRFWNERYRPAGGVEWPSADGGRGNDGEGNGGTVFELSYLDSSLFACVLGHSASGGGVACCPAAGSYIASGRDPTIRLDGWNSTGIADGFTTGVIACPEQG